VPRAHAYNPSYLGGRDQKDQSEPRQIVHETLSPKYLTQSRASRVAQAVECMPSKREALSLLLGKNNNEKDWGCSPSDRPLAWVQSPVWRIIVIITSTIILDQMVLPDHFISSSAHCKCGSTPRKSPEWRLCNW
jgi:hypothetical protein